MHVQGVTGGRTPTAIDAVHTVVLTVGTDGNEKVRKRYIFVCEHELRRCLTLSLPSDVGERYSNMSILASRRGTVLNPNLQKHQVQKAERLNADMAHEQMSL